MHEPLSRLKISLVLFLLIFGLFLTAPQSSFSQTVPKTTREILPPQPPLPPIPPQQSYEVESVELIIDIADQRAKVLLRQTIRNTSSATLELDYMVPLPLNGTVSGLTLVSGGNELVGKIYSKDEAFNIYQQIVSQMKDPALLEFAGYGLFRARAFPVTPGAKASLDLSMDYLLPKDNSRVDLNFPLSGSLTQGRTIGHQNVIVKIKGQKIGGVYSPQSGLTLNREKDLVTAELKLDNVPPLSSFQLYYQEETGPMGGLVLSHKPDSNEDGFFLFMAEPTSSVADKESLAKTVIFALDTSGSMVGQKFEQAQEALIFVLERLVPKDYFNLITFSSDVNMWRPEIEPMTTDNRTSAINYVKSLRAGGATNIEGAINQSLALSTGNNPTYLIFLTDGEPTVGEENEIKLAQIAKNGDNDRGIRIFSFGVGDGVNARLLDRLATSSSGLTTFVSEKENIEEKVSSFFSKISNPVLIKPKLKISLATNRIIPEKLPDIFKGSQLVVLGRYPKGGQATLTLTGQEGENKLVSSYQAELAGGPSENGSQIANLWAQRRIGQIIEEIDQKAQDKPNQELIDELVSLSKKFGIMTPYTSFLALENESHNKEEMRSRAFQNLDQLQKPTGDLANWQRSVKSNLSGAAVSAAPMNKIQEQEELSEMAVLDSEARSGRMEPPRNLGGQTFYLKNGQLNQSTLTEKDLANLKVIKKFSPEYFELAKTLEPSQMTYLTQEHPLAFNLNGQNYLIENES
jgi:Ca-activated chloride channel family protein